MSYTVKVHTLEEINELKEWFEAQTIPETLQIDKCTRAISLRKTVKLLLEQAYIQRGNPNMQGNIILLKKIKESMEKGGYAS